MRLLAYFSLLATGIFFFSTQPTRAQVLSHGPVTGGVTSSSANIFLRTDRPATVALQYSTDPTFATYLVSSNYSTIKSSDYTVTIPLAGLSAETTYYLRPLVNGVQNPGPYSFATFAPTNSSRTFNFVVFTDFTTVKNLDRDVDTFQHATEYAPVFAFIGGDFDHGNPGTINEKRNMFKSLYDANSLHLEDFVNLILHKMPIIHQWDDHDSGDNNSDRTYAHWDWTQQAFQEYVPTYPLPSVSPGIWQNFTYAQLDGFVLDCRSQRDPDDDPDDANKSMLDGNNLGAAGQLVWLEQGLLHSTAKWKIVFTSVVTNPSTKENDGWGAFQTEWNTLKNFILSNNINNVVFIAGDLHLAAIDNGVASGFPEMCVAQPNSRNAPFKCATAANGTWSEGYYDETCSGFGVVSVLQNPDRLQLQAIDEFGVPRISYTVNDQNSTPTPTPTPTATPTPTPPPPTIRKQPRDATAAVGHRAKFHVVADGTPPLSYQWKKNNTNIDGATSDTYSTPRVVQSDDGSLFSVVVSNSGGSVTSNSAKLTVTP
ncbi:MAG TPA: alkaline phosphatase D family protein [Chthoniobacterales bacterium]